MEIIHRNSNEFQDKEIEFRPNIQLDIIANSIISESSKIKNMINELGLRIEKLEQELKKRSKASKCI